MKAKRVSSDDLLTVLKKSKSIRVRAGTGGHRFIGIWFVLSGNRIMARSWSIKPDGWYSTFLKEPRGAIQVGEVGEVEVAVRAVPIKNKRLRDAVDTAYLQKYNTAWELTYAKDLAREKSRATTIELVPVWGSRRSAGR
jgi:hypothetical protein